MHCHLCKTKFILLHTLPNPNPHSQPFHSSTEITIFSLKMWWYFGLLLYTYSSSGSLVHSKCTLVLYFSQKRHCITLLRPLPPFLLTNYSVKILAYRLGIGPWKAMCWHLCKLTLYSNPFYIQLTASFLYIYFPSWTKTVLLLPSYKPTFYWASPIMSKNCGCTEGEDKFIGLKELMHLFGAETCIPDAARTQISDKCKKKETNKYIQIMRKGKKKTIASCRS